MIVFKKATAEDISVIQAVAKKSWETAYRDILTAAQISYMLTEMYATEEIAAQMKNPDYLYFLMMDEGRTIGFMGYEHHYEPNTTKLHRLYLLPEAQGKGAGKLALTFLKEKTAETSDRRIILNVNKQNPARKVYESQKFKIFDEAIIDIGNGFVMDDYVMEYLF